MPDRRPQSGRRGAPPRRGARRAGRARRGAPGEAGAARQRGWRTNLVKHAGGGELIVRALPATAPALEILALDKGGGMASVEESFRDGTRPAAAPGRPRRGRGASRPSSTSTRAGRAARRSSSTWRRPRPRRRRPGAGKSARCASPSPGEEVCGDGWAATDTADGYRLMVADGLGHGPGAAEAARAAVRCFERDPTLGPAAQVSRDPPGPARHPRRGGRGRRASTAAPAWSPSPASAISPGRSSRLGGSRQLVSLNGTAGHDRAQDPGVQLSLDR